MSSKPKKSEYQPSAAEKASAAVAMAENKYFKQKYDPLLQKMRDTSTNDNSVETLRGRANADTMQTLAGKASYDRAATGANGGAEAQAYQAQLGLADKAGLERKNNMQLGVLGTARGQAADATTGMTAAANMGASRVLTQAKAKQTVRSAKFGALAEAGTALVMQGAKNMSSKTAVMTTDADGNSVQAMGKDGKPEFKRGSFTSPVDDSGNRVTGFADRFNFANPST
jgi:hypothetical protein